MPSPRREELLDKAYAYVLENGIADVALRPLAAAIGSSPRVLLYLFESRDGLIAALLHRARTEELAAARGDDPAAVWAWLAAPAHRPLLRLWVESYARSLVDPAGPWAGFAEATVRDWLERLGGDEATGTLATLRGALLDLLATGDDARVGAAVTRALSRPS